MKLNPIIEYERIKTWTEGLKNKKLLLKTFGGSLSRYLNKNGHAIKVKVIRDNSLDQGDFTFGAEYDPELDESGQKPFKLHFIINHPRLVPWEITSDSANEICISLTETLVHEYQHLQQYRSRKWRDLKHTYRGKKVLLNDTVEINYLSNPDEIDAYSANIATRTWIEKHLLNKTNVKEHLDLATYYKAFGKRHPVVLDLKKQIEQKLKLIEEKYNGKKFRRNSWMAIRGRSRSF